jgi:uncharacterized protein YndB with AHSA1/START domain
MEKRFEIYIKTSPEHLWQAITDATLRRTYNFGVGVHSDWTPGSRYAGVSPVRANALFEGENIAVEPPFRLVQSLNALWSETVIAEGTSIVTWEIEQIEDSCALTLTHDRLADGASGELFGGWPMILSGLKTLLETGEALTTPGSLLYERAAPESG